MRITLNTKRLEEYMTKMGWDEKELAKQIGVSQVQVYRVLRGQRSPGNEFIAGLKYACSGLQFEDLFIFAHPLPKGKELNAG